MSRAMATCSDLTQTTLLTKPAWLNWLALTENNVEERSGIGSSALEGSLKAVTSRFCDHTRLVKGSRYEVRQTIRGGESGRESRTGGSVDLFPFAPVGVEGGGLIQRSSLPGEDQHRRGLDKVDGRLVWQACTPLPGAAAPMQKRINGLSRLAAVIHPQQTGMATKDVRAEKRCDGPSGSDRLSRTGKGEEIVVRCDERAICNQRPTTERLLQQRTLSYFASSRRAATQPIIIMSLSTSRPTVPTAVGIRLRPARPPPTRNGGTALSISTSFVNMNTSWIMVDE
ncbi:hypothetical protein K469DRAFT_685775 [Zopfia rhizophila CBS 207.26]|uniref:Uncharacterized protein n=1 Tax=Zopfia rhizophila CBS 207.26 TaxID=1314779 RepID=A0A6A6E8W2_9PEZI|nr:hypothetical protein K469DRAFT_685775 [Zopfia rhizophila CBS 207.26]